MKYGILSKQKKKEQYYAYKSEEQVLEKLIP